ncbi:MAG: bifunctional UDP-sugar hydrolase/5'-nucleotidase [Ignavibacteria bacterium]|nr:bifunctional UDP-sugar hydrolase/5'-nucleotidase [Ignavibacteria bacterium]
MTSSYPKSLRGLLFLAAGLLLFILPILSQSKHITILHTNDMHASFLPQEAYWVRTTPKPLVGGFNELAFAVDSIRKVKSATLLLDAGDLMTGNPITDRVFMGAEGGGLVEMMNLIGYEGWTPGNHDFDISYDNFRKLANVSRFPVFSANLIDEKSGKPVTGKEYLLIKKNGLKIGIFGLMSTEFYNLVSQSSTLGVKLLPPEETAKRMVELLRPKADLLIALTHQGVWGDSVLAVKVKGIDVIVGGHSHTRLPKPKYVNGVVIVQTGSNAQSLGVLDLTVENKSVTRYDGGLLQLWYQPDRKTVVTALVDSFKTEIDREYSEVIGTLLSPWDMDGWETGVGNFMADVQREGTNADVAFMNNHGIRKKLAPGPITKQNLFEVLPFRNVLATFDLTGKQIRDIVLYDIKKKPLIQVSGIQCEWKRDASGNIEIVKLLVNGKPVDDNATYTGAASDYFMGESKRYLDIDTPRMTYLNLTVFDVAEKKIRALKNVDAKIEGRIKEIQ